MEIVAYDAALIEGITECLNSVVGALPHCYRQPSERVAAGLEGKLWRDEDEELLDPQAWVALEAGEVVGFAQAARQTATDDRPARGIIPFLLYRPGYRAAGQGLLATVEAWFAQHSLTDAYAFLDDHVPAFYHFPHSYLSDRLNHVHALLGYNGYSRCEGEVFYEWRDFDPPEPPPLPVEAEIRRELKPQDDARLPGLVIFAYKDGEQIAECWFVSCGSAAPGTEAEDWCLTTWLHVEEAWRGRRLGLYMLFRALGEVKAVGFRHAAISTAVWNHRAQLFYSNCGYRVSDWTYALNKSFLPKN
ncbi:MAG: GNAT family N-acetyltransferase [Armatimonadetes bacterium]|nr:GNAT family N-acetyltransferase [Armatimonadota bacterium]